MTQAQGHHSADDLPVPTIGAGISVIGAVGFVDTAARSLAGLTFTE
jgi:hypothetical protein